MNFSKALKLLKQGAKVRRRSWKSIKYIRRFDPVDDDAQPTGIPGIGYCLDSDWNMLLKWTPTDESLFADDWEVVTDPVRAKLDESEIQNNGRLVFEINFNCKFTKENVEAISDAVSTAIQEKVRDGSLVALDI